MTAAGGLEDFSHCRSGQGSRVDVAAAMCRDDAEGRCTVCLDCWLTDVIMGLAGEPCKGFGLLGALVRWCDGLSCALD